ncbi:hypothetical protein ACOBQX_20545 [Actinokineospora sp. G85]|uniref:hypothetical protein n=1 Tax=Actinokineospora sp. G85 TaxID=3406626 RepID=UPI003C73E2D8
MALASAAAAALTLAGVAVFTVSTAGCANAGEYHQNGGSVELTSGCVDTNDLPAAPQTPHAPANNPGAGIDQLRDVNP